jgi:hypothetical protein
MKAVCEARIIEGDKPLSSWVLGEASPATTKMSTLAGYQNHLAQTRAHNRAIREFISVRLHRELVEGIAVYKTKTNEELPALPIDTSSSGEEIVYEPVQEKPKATGVDYVSALRAKLKELGAKDEAGELAILKDKANLHFQSVASFTPSMARVALKRLTN